MSNSLDSDQAKHFVGPDLGPSCLQKLSADDTRMQRVISLCEQHIKQNQLREISLYPLMKYSKTCVKRPLKNRQNKDLNDKW